MSSSASMTTAGRPACACSSQNPQTDPPAPGGADGPGTDSKHPPDRRGREPTPLARSRRGLRPRLGHAVADHARMAGHRGRLLRDRPGARPVSGRDDGDGHRQAHPTGSRATLASWTPQPDHYDLVTCLYIHVAGSVQELVRRSIEREIAANCCRPGDSGRARGDPVAGRPPPDRPGHRDRNGRRRSGAGLCRRDARRARLAPWELIVAEDRPRAIAGTGVDAMVCARRPP
jgi:hypothetical protein